MNGVRTPSEERSKHLSLPSVRADDKTGAVGDVHSIVNTAHGRARLKLSRSDVDVKEWHCHAYGLRSTVYGLRSTVYRARSAVLPGVASGHAACARQDSTCSGVQTAKRGCYAVNCEPVRACI